MVLLLLGCAAPASAPAELDELVGWLFDHVADDDPAAEQDGAAKLDAWMDDRLEETLEGYVVETLSDDAVDALGDGDRDLSELVGVAVGHAHAGDVDDLAAVIIGEDPAAVHPDTYLSFESDVTDGTRSCFLAHSCDWLETENVATASYGGLIEVVSSFPTQFRWVEAPGGSALVYRTWLHAPASVSPEVLEVEQQFFVFAIVPTAEGARSMQASWVVARIVGVDMDQDFALQMMIDGMAGGADELDAWLAAT